MELEEAKKYLEIMIKTFDTKCPNVNVRNVNCLKVEATKTVLQALDNSIPKEKVEKKIEELNNLQLQTIENKLERDSAVKSLQELLEE